MIESLKTLISYEPHIVHQNTSRQGQETCTVWYDPRTGNIESLGAANVLGSFRSLHMRVDDVGLLPEIVGSDKGREHQIPIRYVLDSIRAYRAEKVRQ